jgi:ribosomal protein S18 acetylase RimI-like enzyme
MSQVLNDFSTPALVYAIKQNLYDLFGYLQQWDKTDFFAGPGLQHWWTPVPYPWFNGALSLSPPASDEAETIRATVTYFQSKGRELFTWWLAPDLEASDWGNQLEANRLMPDNNTPGMAVPLNELNENLAVPAGLKIARVEGIELMKDWVRIFVAGYGLPPDWEAPVLDMMLQIGINLPWYSYLATVNNEPVATSAVFFGAGVAGIQMVATPPEWRGRGLGAAVTLAPLLDARKMGYRVGILQSSDMGFKIYQRLGFKELCRMKHYYWRGK